MYFLCVYLLTKINILPPMIVKIIEKNKDLLRSTGSYMMPRLDRIIELLRTVENYASNDFFNSIERVAFVKGDFFLREGAPCRHILILETGIARQFMNKNGAEPIATFFFPGEFIASYKSFAINTPSKINIQFETDATGYSLSWTTLEKLKLAYPILTEIEKLAFECRSYWLSERFYHMIFSPARERYQNLQCCPLALQQQISLTHIADYLGITLETLSRIRSEIN